MGWNPFKKNTEEVEKNPLEDQSLEIKINDAIKKAQNDKRETLKEIENIKLWQAEAIIDTYAHIFPNGNLSFYREKYKEDAVGKYETIRTENADKVSIEEAEKCEKIVSGYKGQLEMRQSKLKLIEKLETEYLKTKEKLKQVDNQKQRGDKFSKHNERLGNLDAQSETLGNAMLDTQNLEDLKKEFELKQEYVKQLEQLTNQYSDDINIDSSGAFKDEIDKITKGIE